MTQRTYYEPKDDPWTWWGRGDDRNSNVRTGRGGIEVRHGHALNDLDRATRMAIARNVGVNAFSRAERYEIAWSAIALALVEATEPPTLSDLASAGWQAISDARLTEMRHHGTDFNRRVGEQRPSFERYWTWVGQPSNSPEDAIVERLALAQIWPTLTADQQETVAAFAACGSVPAAAAALGIGRSLAHKRVRTARLAFERNWYGDETPPARRGCDRRRPSGEPPDLDAGYRQARRAILRRRTTTAGEST